MIGKFKVWGSVNKKWLKPDNYFLDGNGGMFMNDGLHAGSCGPEIEFVHSTGKTDKNGVELFDGDIDKNFGEICYWKSMWGFNFDQHEFVSLFQANFIHQLEKIGTKFENPELLETK